MFRGRIFRSVRVRELPGLPGRDKVPSPSGYLDFGTIRLFGHGPPLVSLRTKAGELRNADLVRLQSSENILRLRSR